MTYLEIVNSVLRRLRESTVASVTETTYSTMIGEFVNDAKRQVEDAWHWTRLKNTVQVTTTSGTFRYTLSGAGERSTVLYVYNDTEDGEMRRAPSEWMTQQYNGGSPQSESPLYYDFNGFSGDDPTVDLYPIPNGVYNINFDMHIPQVDLVADGDTITVPSQPVILLAYAIAVSERGEDGGMQFAEAQARGLSSLNDMITIDSQKISEKLDWNVV